MCSQAKDLEWDRMKGSITELGRCSNVTESQRSLTASGAGAALLHQARVLGGQCLEAVIGVRRRRDVRVLPGGELAEVLLKGLLVGACVE